MKKDKAVLQAMPGRAMAQEISVDSATMINQGLAPLGLEKIATLTFEIPDMACFP